MRRPVPGLRAAWARWVAIASPWSGAKRGAGAYGYLGDLNRSDRSYGVGLTRGDYGRAGNERIVGKRKLAPRVGSVLLIRRGASSPCESGSKLPHSKVGVSFNAESEGAALLLPIIRVADARILGAQPTLLGKTCYGLSVLRKREGIVSPGLQPGLVCCRNLGAHPAVARVRRAVLEGQRPACISAWGEAPWIGPVVNSKGLKARD